MKLGPYSIATVIRMEFVDQKPFHLETPGA